MKYQSMWQNLLNKAIRESDHRRFERLKEEYGW